ncbi:MAG: ATP-binding cassette, subfamily bacterial [Candidatus Dependentiae bacterium]|nr:ATP-binding cassette, subfamily bacterial [Candidatus Dependentiae bacterium]
MTDKINQLTKSFDRLYEAWAHWTTPVIWSFIFSIIMLSRTNLACAALVASWFLCAIGLSVYLSIHGISYAEKYAAALNNVVGATVNVLQNIFTVKMFGQQKTELTLMERNHKKEIVATQRLQWFLFRANALLSLACIGLIAGISYVLVTAWQGHAMTPGNVTFILATCFNMFNTIWWLSSHIAKMYKDYGIAREAYSIMSTPHQIMDVASACELKVSSGDIVFDKVQFKYKGHATVFSGLSVHIKPGEKIGLVGDSGSGKTTFIHLIMRFYDVCGGSISIDGQDISQVTQESLRHNIALIPQETLLFARSVKENLLYANPHASQADLTRVIAQTHAEQFIEELPHKEDTVLGERGTNISGGQRQRIAIARALLKKAPILILDEATSALDSITEHAISQSLYALMEGRTTIAIAHRLSTLQQMDRLLVFVDGKIVEEGSHEELIQKKKGHYAKMWQLQVGNMIGTDETRGRA